jgi:hypothetical protein
MNSSYDNQEVISRQPEGGKVEKIKEKKQKRDFLSIAIISAITFFVTLPIVLIVDHYMPNSSFALNWDRWLLFVGIYFLIFIVLSLIYYLFKWVFIGGFVSAICFLLVGSFINTYTFSDLFSDYGDMLQSMKNSEQPEQKIFEAFKPFHHKRAIRNAIDYTNPDVRNFAVSKATKNFKSEQDINRDYRIIIQCFSVFKEINSKWQYVNDPSSREYFAKASESIHTLAGDCDDYAIIMSACIQAIGGQSRLVLTNGHLHPELLIGSKSDMEKIKNFINNSLFKNKDKNRKINYQIDKHGQYWINMDYTANHPGGRFMCNNFLGVLNVN